ncbi:Endoplasmic reticulum mannosyl-oligosaccharide 1,2-alpha-mannosidase, partial [Gonapodya sp. JEL0774]
MLPTHRAYNPNKGNGYDYAADKGHKRSLTVCSKEIVKPLPKSFDTQIDRETNKQQASLRIWTRRNPNRAAFYALGIFFFVGIFLYTNVGRPAPTPTIPVTIPTDPPNITENFDKEIDSGHVPAKALSNARGKAQGVGTAAKVSKATKNATVLDTAAPSESILSSDVSLGPTPEGTPSSTSLASGDIWWDRREQVSKAFLHAWDGYRKYAWGYDELEPLSQRGRDWFGMGLTIIDAMDTSLIMGFNDDYQVARDWVVKSMKLEKDVNANVFEVTIRVLGGILSAYHLSGANDTALLNRAVEVGNLLILAFDTASKIPLASVNPALGRAVASHDRGDSSTAEVTTVQLEFRYLSYLTGEVKFWKAVEDVMVAVGKLEKYDGLVPIFISPVSGQFTGSEIRLGSRGDSYYEYLLKQYLQTNGTEQTYLSEFDAALV